MITSRTPRRVAAALALGAAFATALLSSTAPAAASQRPAPVPTVTPAGPPVPLAVPAHAATVAIDDITAAPSAADPLAGIPSDFSAVMGYRPVLGRLANGEILAINPNGGCSVIGGGEPFDLSTVCKAHDLGYDLLRYAQRHGDPLNAQSRVQVDDKFGVDLRTQCAARYSGPEISACDAMATTFDAAVGFNSWRQDYGPPVAAAGMGRTVGVITFGILMLYFVGRSATVRLLGRKRRTLRPTLVPAAEV